MHHKNPEYLISSEIFSVESNFIRKNRGVHFDPPTMLSPKTDNPPSI